MRLYFARHGESTANLLHVFSNRQADHLLTEKGRRQVRSLAGKLIGQSIHLAYSSPVPRAVESAEIIAEELQISYTIAEALREFDVGELEGRSDASAWQQFSDLIGQWLKQGCLTEKIRGGESYQEIKQRFTPFIQQLITTCGNPDQNILLISHGGLLRIMLPEIIQNIDHEFTGSHPLGNTDLVTTELVGEALICREWAGIQTEID